MTKLRRSLLAAAGATLAAGSLALAAPAMAATITENWTNMPTVVQATQGETVQLQWAMELTNHHGDTPQALDMNPGDTTTITFNAPTGTTFPAQSTVPWDWSMDATTWNPNGDPLSNCVVGGGGATLTCSWTSPGTRWGTYQRMKPTVQVSPTATAGTFSAAANLSTDGHQWDNPSAQDVYKVNNGTLDIQIAQSAPVPVVDPVVGGAALAGMAALGGTAVYLNRRRQKNAAGVSA